MLLEQWYLTSVENIVTGEVTLFGLIAGTALLGFSHVVYSYAMKRFRVSSLIIILALSLASYFIASIITTLTIPKLGYFDENLHLFLLFIFAFLALVGLSLIFRKKKPAHHHFKVENKKKRLRYSS